ncbi:MAG: CaiB/BaiF CoA transferase family protein [Burkholderiaceae bacterium]
MRPLEDVRVVDFTEGAQGPFATSLLADLGAEVVKVERPAGELMRHVGPFAGGLALPMLSIARGRHASLSIDVKTPAGRSTALQLVAAADLLIQNWKPGTDAKLGLSWEAVHAINPRLVYVRASGYGPHGPFGSMGAMDSLSSAIGGLSSLSGDPAGRGERMRTPILDFVSAFVAAEAALVGLAARRRHGRGTLVDTSQMASALDAAAPEVAASAWGAVRPAGRTSRWSCFGGWFECSDGAWVSLECHDAAELDAAALALGVADARPLGPAIARALRGIDAGAALERLRAAGLGAQPVRRQFRPDVFDGYPGAIGVSHDADAGEVRHPETPFAMSATPPRAGPPLGRIGRDDVWLDRLLDRWTRAAAVAAAASSSPTLPDRSLR